MPVVSTCCTIHVFARNTCLVGAGRRQRHDHRRRAVAARGRPAIHQAAHELLQALDVERAVLEVVVDVVGPGLGQGATALVASILGRRVVDGLALLEQLDRFIDTFRHTTSQRILSGGRKGIQRMTVTLEAGVRADRPDAAYARLEERILARDQQGAMQTLF